MPNTKSNTNTDANIIGAYKFAKLAIFNISVMFEAVLMLYASTIHTSDINVDSLINMSGNREYLNGLVQYFKRSFDISLSIIIGYKIIVNTLAIAHI